MKLKNPIFLPKGKFTRKLLSLVFLMLFMTGMAFAQQKTVTGKIIDQTGASLPGVTVLIKGTTVGVITDNDGNFSLTKVPQNGTLIISFVGMKSQEIAVGGKNVINVTLLSDVIGIEEVVAVGYGTQKRANVLGAVASVDGKQLQAIPSMNVSTALSGLIPGLTVIQGSGEPGQMTPRLMVRGRTTLNTNNDTGSRGTDRNETKPLVVIDGVPGRSMDEIDPSDIATLSVLKDASAAIYGSSAANGVILITTKSGKDGKPRLSYQFYEGFMTPSLTPKVTDAFEYATMITEYQVYKGAARTYSDADLALYANGKDPWLHPNTNWYNDLIKTWSTTTRHSVTLDGGSNGMKYYVSFGYKTDDAMYKASSTKYKQYNVRAKLDMPINSWLKTGVELAGFLNNSVYPYRGAGDIVGASTRLYPTKPAFWPTGQPGPDIEYGDNPVETSTLHAGKNDQNTYRFLSTFKTTIIVPFIKGLSFNGSFNYDLTNYYEKKFFQPWYLYTQDTSLPVTKNAEGYITAMPLIAVPRGLSSPQNDEKYNRTINQTILLSANYAKTLGDHTISLFGGFEQYSSNWNEFAAFRKYYISPIIQTMNAGNPKDQNITGNATVYGRKSWIGRATYDYKGKYMAEVDFRADGSLKFPKDQRWGYFPGFLLGWRASEENFWKNNFSFVNYFKLRGSFSMLGMDPTDPFQYMDKYNIGSGMTFGTGGAIQTVVGPPSVANPLIHWETQKSYNLGFDSKFKNDMFHLNTDVFYSRRDNILTTRDASVPNFTGLSLPAENIGIVDNRGIEIDFGFHKALNKDLRLDASVNYSYNHNKVIFTDEAKQTVAWQQRTGHPFGAWLMYDAIGIFKDQAQVDATTAKDAKAGPGDVIFRDVNGDGKITGDDQILVDHVDMPEVFYGGTISVTYKAFTLTAQVQGQGKFLKNSQWDDRRGEAGNYYQWQYDNRWTPTNTVTNIARAYNRNDQYWSTGSHMNTYWMENTAYCRLKNLVLNYAIPANLTSKIGISKASIYVTGNNLAYLYTATKKWDPETLSAGSYPTMKTFAIGANITF